MYKGNFQTGNYQQSLPVRHDLEEMAERARRIDKVRIQRMLEARGVKALYHFTPIENLKNLAQFGIMSRADLVENQLDFIPTDELRIDGVNNASCLSLSFPNYKMFYRKRCELSNVTDWVVLKIRPNVLWQNPCLFMPRNAASFSPYLKKSPGHFLGAPALSRVFDEAEKVFRDEMGLGSDLPTNPQTEILAFGSISNDMVMAILTKDIRSLRHARSMILGSEFENRVVSDASVFRPRSDHSFWVH